jgi:beta-lactamase class A
MAAVAKLARDAQVLVAKVDRRTCNPIAALDASRRLAIGSAFKLWVLLALHEKLSSDANLSWATTLPIRDDLKSLPSGVLQNQPAGTSLTLDEYASKMISISDNTATDHLIEFVGRTAVENAQRTSGHGDPAANIPWYTTRELFVLKTSVSAGELDAFRRASLAEKRSQLTMLRSRTIDVASLNSWSAPRLLDLEWFASPEDLCGVLATLAERAAFVPTSQLLKVLGLNSGIAFDGAQWSYVGFKGGSEPGVLNLSWLLQHVSGTWFSVVVTLNDPATGLDENAAVVAVAAMMPLLSAEASASSR